MYRVQLQDFEGPLDLLLLLINRREIDIFDIPIAQITNEYLSYIGLMQSINLDGVGDYIYFAALLISIKARMLLPQPETDSEEEQGDPRQQIVDQLLEYIRYKEASESLNHQREHRSLLYNRGKASTPVEAEISEKEVLVQTTLFDLVSALRDILEKDPDEQLITIARQEYSVEEQTASLRKILSVKKRAGFGDLVSGKGRAFIVAMFLAVLEMAFAQEVLLSNTYDENGFAIEIVESKNESYRARNSN